MKYANLHMHSKFSDGGFTPEQLVLIGKSLGYRAMALTDHETDGGVKRFFTAATAEGLDVMSGVEFYGRDCGFTFHILALDYDMDDPGFRRFVQERRDAYSEWTRKIVERGVSLDILTDFSWNDVLDVSEEGTWICVEQLFEAMMKKGLLSHFPKEEETKRVRALLINAPEAQALRTPNPSAEEVIRVIRKAGGVAVLAHPTPEWTKCVDILVGYGLNGIEVSHPDFIGNWAYLASEAAKTYRLYRSGGTDHTGALSCCGGNLAIPALQGITDEEFYTMKERRLS